ncbi:MAG: type II secretion system protein [Chthoniobacterales bacterium]|nr:type II secretion system protein [Chthoniobacterales bacterium]
MTTLHTTLRPEKNGFTLTELLVVIAIILVLAAIALPVFGGIRQRALGAKCLSNLRQVGQGTLMYAADKETRLPFEYRDGQWQGGGTDPFWYISVAPYLDVPIRDAALGELEHPGPFACPADKIPWVLRGFQVNRPSCSYAYPILLTPIRQKPTAPNPLRLSAIPYTSKWVMLVDSVFGNVFNHVRLNTEDRAANDPYETMSKLQNRHKGLNAVFLDGHCERLPAPVSDANPTPDTRLWGPILWGVNADL